MFSSPWGFYHNRTQSTVRALEDALQSEDSDLFYASHSHQDELIRNADRAVHLGAERIRFTILSGIVASLGHASGSGPLRGQPLLQTDYLCAFKACEELVRPEDTELKYSGPQVVVPGSIRDSFEKRVRAGHNVSPPLSVLPSSTYWDPVVGERLAKERARVVSFFSHAEHYSLSTRIAIFPVTAAKAIFEAENGMLLFDALADLFERGVMALVPAAPIDAGFIELLCGKTKKAENKPKKGKGQQYVFRLMDPSFPGLDGDIITRRSGGQPVTPRSLDGAPVRFRGRCRPDLSLVFWHYCTSVVRLRWRHPDLDSCPAWPMTEAQTRTLVRDSAWNTIAWLVDPASPRPENAFWTTGLIIANEVAFRERARGHKRAVMMAEVAARVAKPSALPQP